MLRFLALVLLGFVGLAVMDPGSPLQGRPPAQSLEKLAVLSEGSEGSAGSGSRGGNISPPAEQPISLVVHLPATAQLEIDGNKTSQTGEVRRFNSPPLPTGKPYTYQLKCTWTENGKPVTRERTVSVRAGEETSVDLRQETPK